ncbi:MAG: hypothetical protein ACTHM1_12170 [Solirubrobacteraceae bacterium]
MAYVVGRRSGRFEVRESLHTPAGSRARTLAGFRVLDDDVLDRASARAVRPFDAKAVVASARHAGAPVKRGTGKAAVRRGFVEASRRAGRQWQMGPPQDPGALLIDLLGFADAVAAGQPPRRFQPLAFPPLARLARERPRRRDAVAVRGR